MKTLKRISIYASACQALITSCEPIEDREILENSFDPDKIELLPTHSSPGSNLFTLKMNTQGVTGYWDYSINKGFSDEVEVLYPIARTHTFTYVVSTGYLPKDDIEYITKTIDVEITTLDKDVPEQWGYLVGDGSKTWVFDKSDLTRWWYMTDADWNVFWWQPEEEPSDEQGRMTFDLQGKPNFIYYATPDADPVTGSTWVFNSDFSRLTIIGDANILGVEGGGEQAVGLKECQIIE